MKYLDPKVGAKKCLEATVPYFIKIPYVPYLKVLTLLYDPATPVQEK